MERRPLLPMAALRVAGLTVQRYPPWRSAALVTLALSLAVAPPLVTAAFIDSPNLVRRLSTLKEHPGHLTGAVAHARDRRVDAAF